MDTSLSGIDLISWCFKTAVSHGLTEKQTTRYKASVGEDGDLIFLRIRDWQGAWVVQTTVSKKELPLYKGGVYDFLAIQAERMMTGIRKPRK